MKTYWDYTEQERANLTDSDIQALLDGELMVAGVLKPKTPVLTPILKPADIGPRKRFFGVESKSKYGSDESIGLVFETTEQAAAFIALNPFRRDYDYDIGHEHAYAKALVECKVTTEELYSYETIVAAHSALKKNKAAKDANDQATSDFNKACEQAERITQKVWEDWEKCKRRAWDLRKVVETFDEYKRITEGDEQLALTFLQKAYSTLVIDATRDWYPDKLPPQVMAVAAQPEAA